MTNKGGRPKGYKVTDETKQKTSESMKGKQNNKGKHWHWKNRKNAQETLLK